MLPARQYQFRPRLNEVQRCLISEPGVLVIFLVPENVSHAYRGLCICAVA